MPTTYPVNPLVANQFTEQNRKRLALTAVVFICLWLLLGAGAAHAQSVGSGPMPWVKFTETLACQLQGPWVKWLAVIAIALAGVMFGLGELSGPFKRTMEIAGGFSIAVAATLIVGTLLPDSQGLVCSIK